MIRLRRRPRLVGALAAVALALAPALPGGAGAQAATAPTKGYWFVAADGGIFNYGDASFAGSTGNLKLNQPIVGMASSPTARGYWFVAADGGIFSFGDAKFFGSTGNIKLNRPIVGMAASPTGRGYWFVASDGGIFSFGDAPFYGSTGATKLAKPIVGMAATPTGRGYWFVASDGGIFNYGDAKFFGSAVNSKLKAPIVGMASSPTGQGYYLAASDGTVAAFGDAAFKGSMGGQALKNPIVGIAPTGTGGGYWLVASDGGIFSFGDAAFYGSTGAVKLNRPIVGMAAAPQKSAVGTSPTNPGGGNGGGTIPTNPGGTPTTLPGPGTTPTTIPAPNIDWGNAGNTLAISRASGGGNAYRPWMSDNGRYVVFDSDGRRVIAGTVDPAPGIRDIYLYDRTNGSIERISVGVNGARAAVPSGCDNPCGSQRPTISANGRYIAFWSDATNLVPGDTNGVPDAFLFDRDTRTMTLVSKAVSGVADGESRRPVVSRDGSFVAFESAASNLIAPEACTGLPLVGRTCTGGDKNNADDVFLYDVANKTVTLVSADANGAAGNGASNRPSLSGNGRRVAFQSSATNLVSGGAGTQVYLRDMASGQMVVVSAGPAGLGDKNSTSPSVSADGNWVSFDSKATNFADGDTGGDVDIFVKNLSTGALEQVSVRTGGGQATGTNGSTTVGGDSTISADGRFVAFWSNASTLVDGDTNGSTCEATKQPCADVFVRDRVAGTTTRIVSTNGVQGDENSYAPALSMDGRLVAFDSKANSLDPTATPNSGQDIYVHVNF